MILYPLKPRKIFFFFLILVLVFLVAYFIKSFLSHRENTLNFEWITPNNIDQYIEKGGLELNPDNSYNLKAEIDEKSDAKLCSLIENKKICVNIDEKTILIIRSWDQNLNNTMLQIDYSEVKTKDYVQMIFKKGGGNNFDAVLVSKFFEK